jgi:hypothetical protein
MLVPAVPSSVGLTSSPVSVAPVKVAIASTNFADADGVIVSVDPGSPEVRVRV